MIALGILLVTSVFSESTGTELPMLFVAGKLHPSLMYIYAFLLFFGIYFFISTYKEIKQMLKSIKSYIQGESDK